MGIIPIDSHGNTWLVGQYRYALNKYSWEIPAGGGPLEEDGLSTAKRELQEETGLIAKKWTPIIQMELSNSVTDELGVVYLAQDITEGGMSSPDPSELLRVKKLSVNQAIDMVQQGKVKDSLSVVGLLQIQHIIHSKKLSF